MTLDDATRERLFGYERALDHPVSLAIVVGVLVGLVVSGGLILGMRQRIPPLLHQLPISPIAWQFLVFLVL